VKEEIEEEDKPIPLVVKFSGFSADGRLKIGFNQKITGLTKLLTGRRGLMEKSDLA